MRENDELAVSGREEGRQTSLDFLEQQEAQTHPSPFPRPVWRDFALALLATLLLILLVVVGEYVALPPAVATGVNILRLLLGLGYVLFLPGYCLVAALFPGAGDLDSIERAGLSLGLSVAWVSVLALILDQLPWGLRLWPIFLGELASVGLFMVIAFWRRSRLPQTEVYVPLTGWHPRAWWASLPRLDRRIYLLCVGALLTAGLAAAWIFLVPSPDEFMTEFYLLGDEGLAESYPREAVPGEEIGVTMGIHNREREAHTYRLEVWAIDPWEDRRQQVQTAGPFTLAPGEGIEQPLLWAMPWAGQDQMVEFYLFSEQRSDTGPYRQLRLWLNVRAN